jgi:hypothetical protein
MFYKELKVKLTTVIHNFSENHSTKEDEIRDFSLEECFGKLFIYNTHSSNSEGLQNFDEIQDARATRCADLTRNYPHLHFQKYGNYQE